MKKLLLLLIIQLGYISSIKAQEKVAESFKTKIISQETVEIQDVPTEKKNETESLVASRGGGTVTGSTYGELSVSLTGAAQYNVPIDVPPGLNGVQPEISLTYNSQGGNGLAGWGWNISGISIITRIPTTLYHDNEIDPVDFDLKDRFALDGQRLILKSGTYGASGAQYQTENYSNVKITSHGANPISGVSGPKYFTVRYPDGSFAEYSIVSHTDYAITYWENPQGVRISYEYKKEGNGLLISKIKYGSRNSTTPINKVVFNYIVRERNERAYSGGAGFNRSSKLQEIEVFGNNVPYRNYLFAYTLTSLGYDLLTKITEKTGDNSESRSPIRFYYTNTKTEVSSLVGEGENELSISGLEQRNTEVVSLDVNGNGKMDFIAYPTQGDMAKKQFWVFSNIQEGTTNIHRKIPLQEKFEEIFPINWFQNNGMMGEGQGVVIIQNLSNNKVRFKVHGGSLHGAELVSQYDKIWDLPTYNTVSYCGGNTYNTKIPQKYLSGDFDGDGLIDVLAIAKNYSYNNCQEYPCDNGGLYYKTSTSSNKSIGDSTSMATKALKLSPTECCECTTYNVSNGKAYLIDLNRMNTSGFAKPVGYLSSGILTNDKILTMDVNGDGKTDILKFKDGIVYVYSLNSSNNSIELLWSTTSEKINLNYHIYPGDYNGDGKADFMIPGAENSYEFSIFTSTGEGFLRGDYTMPFKYIPTKWNGSSATLYGYNLIPTDINGDGKTDIIDYKTITYNGNSNGTQTLSMYVNYKTGISPFTKKGNTVTRQGYLKHYPIPIFLSSDKNNENLDFASISDRWFTSYTFSKDHRKDVELKNIVNNGIQTNITYAPLKKNYRDTNGKQTYFESPYSLNETFPYVDIDVSLSFRVVSKLEQTGSEKTRTKKFEYTGAVFHAIGLGFLGFKEQRRTNWYGDGVGELWNISKYNPQLKGAVTEEWVSTSPSSGSSFMSHTKYYYDYKLIANPGSPSAPEYDDNKTIDYPIPGPGIDKAENSIRMLPGFYANGSNGTYTARIVPPDAQAGASGYAGVSNIILAKTENENGLTGVKTTETYAYDEYKNIIKSYTTFPGGNKTITYQYNNNREVNSTSYHVGRIKHKTERTVLNGNSFTIEENYTYDNNLVKTFKKRGNGTSWLTEDFMYDVNGNVKSKTLSGDGVASRTEYYKYEGYGGRFLTESTDIEGLVTTYTYDASTGNPKTTTNPDGLTTTFGYDQWGRLTSEMDYLNKTITQTYTPLSGGELKKTTNYPEGAKEEIFYNAFGWVTKSGNLSLNGQWVYKSFEYDVAGRQTKESEPYAGSAASQWNTTYYDQYGRVSDQELYNGKIGSVTYSGLSTTVDDGIKTVTITVDAFGNKIKVVDPGGTVNYTYYANGMMKTADYGGHEVSVQIDGWGRKTKLIDPAAGTYTYKYDIFGQLLEETTPKGKTVNTYNGVGKIFSKKIIGDVTNMSLSYQYNGPSNLLSSISGNNITDEESYNYTYTYDTYNRPKTVKEVNGSASFEKQMSYDGYGRVNTERLITKNLSSGTISDITTKNVYDPSSGLLEEIRDYTTSNTLWKANSINARGQALNISLGNGMVQTRSYDSYGFVQTIKDQKSTSSGTTVALNLAYNFNAQQGTLTSRKNNKFSWNENFGYDNLDRLKTISGNVSKTMMYDNDGRITNNSSIGQYSYETSNRYRLKEITPNTTGASYFEQHPTQRVSYNAFKKPVEINEEGHGRASFEYSPMMNRSHAYYGGTQANKEQRRSRKHYSAIIPAEIVEDTQTGNTKIITYVGGDEYSASIAHIKKTGSGAINEYHYLHRDYLGSIMGITDASGDIKEQRQFGAWGTVDKFVDSQNNTTFTHSSLIGRGYTGHEHFFEVGLIHMNGRMYDANLSRFLSPDNYIQDPFNTQNYNRYSYVLNNPLKYVDINGENYGGAGVENGGNGWLYSLAVIVSSIFASWGEEIKNSQIGRWLNTNIGKPVERWVNKHIVNPIKKLFGSGKKNPISYDVPSMEFAGAIPSGNNLQIATSMPTTMAFNSSSGFDGLMYKFLAFETGYRQGFIAGAKNTWDFAKSLTTSQGWKDLGQGFMNMAAMSNMGSVEGMMLRTQIAQATDSYIKNIPNMSAYEMGHDFGYGVEKATEAFLLSKGAGIGVNTLRSGVGFGVNASRYGLGEALWQTSKLGPRSYLFGRYHSRFVPYGRRGILNTGMKTGAGWSNHGTRHVFRVKYNGKKYIQIYK